MEVIPATFFEMLGFVLVIAALFALVSRALKLPLLVGYIAAGSVIGMTIGHSETGHEVIKGTSQTGLILLLFLVGLELNWDLAKKQFKNAFGLGLIQIISSLVLGFATVPLFNFTLTAALYVGIALSFASTVVVVKLLSEVNDINALHGRLAVSILLIQDLFAVIALMTLTGISNRSEDLPLYLELLLLCAKTTGVLLLAWSCNRLFLPALFKRIAKSTELLFLCSIAWCFLWVICMKFLEVPVEIGALIAGVSLATLPYSLEIVNKIKVLRDFFVVLLFVGIGSEIHAPSAEALPVILFFFAAVSFGRPALSFVTLALAGYRVRTAFLTSLTQSQLSEFSIILIGIGVTSGQLDDVMTGIIATTAAVSIAFSSILFGGRNILYKTLKPFLKLFERGHHLHTSLVLGDETSPSHLENHVVIFGYHRMGYHIVKPLLKLDKQVVVVDMNPEIINHLRKEGILAIYGDAEDEEIFEACNISKADTVVSTIPHPPETTTLIHEVQQHNKKATLIVTSHSLEDASRYYKLGADFVILPHVLGGSLIGELIADGKTSTLKQSKLDAANLLKKQQDNLFFE